VKPSSGVGWTGVATISLMAIGLSLVSPLPKVGKRRRRLPFRD